MAVVAIAVFAIYVALATVRPLVVSRRRTGDLGFRSATNTKDRVIGALFPCAYFFLALGSFSDLTGTVDRIATLDGPVAQAVGLVLAAAGLPLIVVAQEAMGMSWRIGVDPKERTALVTGGPFRWIRNPIYSGMVLMALGIALLVPNAFTLAGVAIIVAAAELQVRVVEEPYLVESHGDSFRQWAAGSGRFVPGIGTLR